MVDLSDGYVLEEICRGYDDLAECIENESFNYPLDFVNVSRGVKDGFNPIQNQNLWVSDFTVGFLGLCQTLNTSEKMDVDFLNGSLFFALKKTLDYEIYIHDPNYFMINVNPLAMPYFRFLANGSDGNYYYKMRRVYHKNIQYCNPDPNYKFSSCIKTSLASRIGCRLKWDKRSDAAVSLCTTIEEYR